MAQQYGDAVTIVGVSGRDTIEAMAEFVARHGVHGIDHAADVDGEAGDTTARFGALGEEGLIAAIAEHLDVTAP